MDELSADEVASDDHADLGAGEGGDARGRRRRGRRSSSTAPWAQWASLQDYSINWITSLLRSSADELGEEAVERALRKTGDEFVRPRRGTGVRLGRPAGRRAGQGDRPRDARQHRQVEVDEDDEKIVLSFRCGSGGRLIDDGRYEGDTRYLVLREPRAAHLHARRAARLLRALLGEQRDPAGRVGRHPDEHRASPPRAGERCVHHVYKDVGAIPADAYHRIGLQKSD